RRRGRPLSEHAGQGAAAQRRLCLGGAALHDAEPRQPRRSADQGCRRRDGRGAARRPRRVLPAVRAGFLHCRRQALRARRGAAQCRGAVRAVRPDRSACLHGGVRHHRFPGGSAPCRSAGAGHSR
ncbi:MAG TPA: hypothetical protein DD444_09190, partial [Citreicella sp.]|nr:hypothetical protein [Citreicella sp.]